MVVPALDKARVLIVDSRAQVRAGLRAVLASAPSLEVVGEAASAAEALALLNERHADLLVLEAGLLNDIAARGTQPGPSATETVLTGRRRAILRLVAEGLSNREIAQRTNLSELTVKGYLEEILAALGARNRVQAAVLAIRRGLI